MAATSHVLGAALLLLLQLLMLLLLVPALWHRQ